MVLMESSCQKFDSLFLGILSSKQDFKEKEIANDSTKKSPNGLLLNFVKKKDKKTVFCKKSRPYSSVMGTNFARIMTMKKGSLGVCSRSEELITKKLWSFKFRLPEEKSIFPQQLQSVHF